MKKYLLLLDVVGVIAGILCITNLSLILINNLIIATFVAWVCALIFGYNYRRIIAHIKNFFIK